ncbi:peptidyl-prolyl cis-trans isomerase FKBP8-like [Sinocyclocheilus grahami]|uniref:peptidyl-prolyl cis-trans isomerase FKBP8-like n=1 Tax=Sinocyclocheilus grahami TaxID=75366 RepID=UPI0007AD4BFE|nr:PREDICTED: peptidyl-prolyl cis-trans isomerase FKBP8-like [Sinocyclocheilus grahami]
MAGRRLAKAELEGRGSPTGLTGHGGEEGARRHGGDAGSTGRGRVWDSEAGGRDKGSSSHDAHWRLADPRQTHITDVGLRFRHNLYGRDGADREAHKDKDSQRCASDEEDEEVNDYRVKCLNNLAAAQLKLGQSDEALHTSRDVLFLDPQNVKALFRKGKLLSDKGEYEEAMENLKKALKLEPSTKAIHAELSKLVKRQAGENETQTWQAKPAQVLGENIAPFLTPPPEKKPFGISWKFLLGALVVALGSLVTSVVLSARN